MDLPRSLTSALDAIELKLLDKRAVLAESEAEEENSQLQELVRSFEKPHKPLFLAATLSNYEFSHSQALSGDLVLESEWLVLAKACVVVVRSLMADLFTRSLPLGQDILYWEQLLSSRTWRGLYFVQTMPLRLFQFSKAVIEKVNMQLQRERLTFGTLRASVFDRSLFRRFAFPHLSKTNTIMAAPRIRSLDTVVRQEIRTKLDNLKGLRDAQAQAIGLLVSQAQLGAAHNLASEVIYIADLLDTSVRHASQPYLEEQNTTFAEPPKGQVKSPNQVAQKLIEIAQSFKTKQNAFEDEFDKHAAPSTIVRYWPAMTCGYFGSVLFSRYIAANEDRIRLSAKEMIQTISGFWMNWIVDPFQKILATIRHDKGSEVALLSSRSLSTDLESLERMVVEFAQDNPQYSQAATLEELKLSARNGDLTPVLVAYESNIKSPLRSAITGSLIRALLIQIQKTKVDVEVAINGIDKLLKSQELVFGFISVSPALVVVWLSVQWFSRIRGSENRGRHNMRLNSIKTLRNLDRLLCVPHDEEIMTYKRRGLVLCEAQLLRRYSKCIGSDLRHQYLEDVTDLERAGELQQTRQVMTRIFRIYAGNLSYK